MFINNTQVPLGIKNILRTVRVTLQTLVTVHGVYAKTKQVHIH